MLRVAGLVIWLAACVNCGTVMAVNLATDVADRFSCGEDAEAQVWFLWDKEVKRYFDHDLLEIRLKGQGDVYALYDFQTFAHNAVAMARRCNRTSRLFEVAQLISKAYEVLAPGNFLSPGRRWICRGGSICNETNHLLNKEVMLTSVQFLGLASSVANALATADRPLNSAEYAFVKETTEVITEHLLRWGDGSEISKLNKLAQAKPEDVADGSSALFFSDKNLWLIAIYAELSGIVRAQGRYGLTIPAHKLAQLRQHLSTLLRFFLKRVSVRSVEHSWVGKIDVADIDRGYWRSYVDNQYAGYDGEKKPVICMPGESSKSGATPKFVIPPTLATRRPDTGWDFSHARRLVHAFDAISRNRTAMQSIFSLPDKEIPSAELFRDFANNLIAIMWNGDLVEPLLSNYWSGANGWFRVAYDNGTGECREGYPPYGMTESFVTGGYVTWARYRPEIGLLGKSIYMLISDPDGTRSPFITKYYSDLSSDADKQTNSRTKFAFFPTLVGIGIH